MLDTQRNCELISAFYASASFNWSVTIWCRQPCKIPLSYRPYLCMIKDVIIRFQALVLAFDLWESECEKCL